MKIGDRVMVVKMDTHWGCTKFMIGKIATVVVDKPWRRDEVGIDFGDCFKNSASLKGELHTCNRVLEEETGYFLSKQCLIKI